MELAKVHIMVDIETYGLKPDAIILSIGATEITRDCVEVPAFYEEISIESQPFRVISEETVNWWGQQINAPIRGTTHIEDTLHSFRHWLAKFAKTPVIWCKGTDFDVAILTHAYREFEIPIPWKYSNVRDCRTVFKLAGITPKEAEHNALQDAIEQAEDLLAALRILGKDLA